MTDIQLRHLRLLARWLGRIGAFVFWFAALGYVYGLIEHAKQTTSPIQTSEADQGKAKSTAKVLRSK